MAALINELEGKVAIVTGSARNIGRATAEELARAGASIIINAVQAKDLCDEVAEGICANGGKAIPIMVCREVSGDGSAHLPQPFFRINLEEQCRQMR